MTKPCEKCGRHHSDPTTDVRVFGSRFAPGQKRFRADYDGAPMRDTRDETREREERVMGCQRVPYKHAGGTYYADANDCNGCDVNGTEHCDGWRKKPKKANRRTASMKPKRKGEPMTPHLR